MRGLRRFAAALLGFAVPFGAGELWLQAVDPYHFGEKEDWSQYGAKIMDPATGRLRPGAVATYLGTTTRISSQGWRSPEFAVPKPPDVFRVLLLGGSVPFGWGVEQGDEFPRVVERLLNERRAAGAKRVEVINTGVPGWKLHDEGKLLLTEGFGWQPDLVLLLLVATDAPGHVTQQRSFFLDERLRRCRLLRAIENRYVFDSPGSGGESYDAYAHIPERGLDLVVQYLGLFAQHCETAGVRLVVVDTLNVPRVRERCAQLGLHRIEGYTAWTLRRSWEVAVTDAHPNAEGHRYYARLIVDGLSPALFRSKR
ncbi:MAG: hypothetical protein KDC87_10125 [Planctomycetes bacterium]|nr:hypothetical protein [Planctomycetota bacterium]MCB9870665.1 hypothetical protein [Planctomycetota bacterium]MCB9888674.1 hypothetical protein [Planctomycetota bacterium]MCB9889973.1 hypothetical protein [Planctomycetota bacterium]